MLKSSAFFNIEEIAEGIDVLEESIYSINKDLLDILLLDRTTRKNIMWATKDYEYLGEEFSEFAEILPQLVIERFSVLIQPRVTKSQNAKTGRTREKAEVFTPSWICNKQNNLIDEQWFGRTNVFNTETDASWETTIQRISFDGVSQDWKKYVDAPRLEVACGEAPYLVSRYDTVTGEKIPLERRIGLLDRKMRIVKENATSDEEWLKWSKRTFESVYGYEYQGDNLLLARENLLYSYIEYYFERFQQMPNISQLKDIARIISWNIWQMDGLKLVVPASCKPVESNQISLFEGTETNGSVENGCPGCMSGDIYAHTGMYCKIMDWRAKKSLTFLSMLKGGK